MNNLFDWGGGTPEQRAAQRQREMEDALYEQAVRMRVAMQAGGVGGGSKAGDIPVDFTIEWFMKATKWSIPTSHPRMFSLGAFPAPNAVSIENNGQHIYWWANGTYRVDAATTFSTGVWYHIAITRQDGQLKIYKDGTQVGQDGEWKHAIPSKGNELLIGAEPDDSWFNGYLTNFRWTAATLYTGNFTRPAAPLTALPKTKLLLLATDAPGLLTDSSTHARTVTNHGGATWSSDDPFGGAGGSIQFDGTQWLTAAASPDWDL